MAKQATISADEAERRYEHLIHLTRIAKIEADSIRDIAVNLTDTARSVAKLAIGICRSSYWGEDLGRDPPFTIQTHLGLHELQKLSGSKMERDAGGSEQDLVKDSRDPSDGMDQQYPGNDEGHDSSGLVEDADKIQEGFDRNSDQDQAGAIPSDLNNHIETGLGSADSNRDLVSSKNSNLFVGFAAISPSTSSTGSSRSGSRTKFSILRAPDEKCPDIIINKYKSMLTKNSLTCMARVRTGCSSTSSREMSSDSEVEDLLTRPVELPVINKIRNLELLSTDAIDTNCLSCPKRSHHAPHDVKPRPLSPLLQLSEKDHFMIPKEDGMLSGGCSTCPKGGKQIFMPIPASTSSLESNSSNNFQRNLEKYSE